MVPSFSLKSDLPRESRGFTIKFEILIRSSQGLTASGTDPGDGGGGAGHSISKVVGVPRDP